MLTYNFKHAAVDEQRLIEMCYAQRRPLPDFIQNAPELLLGLEFYFNAFLSLTTCRINGFGVGQIPWTAIKDYCDVYGIDGDDREDMFYVIQKMDKEYIKLVSSKKPTT